MKKGGIGVKIFFLPVQGWLKGGHKRTEGINLQEH